MAGIACNARMEPHPASTSEFHTPFEFQIDERQNEISSDPSADTISRLGIHSSHP